MKKIYRIVTCVVMASVAGYGEEVFKDSFSTLDNWKKIEGSVALESAAPAVDHAPFLKLGNGLIFKKMELSAPFTFKAKVLHSAYRRGMMICFLDAKLEKGYGILWDSGTEDGYNGEGNVSLYDISLEKPAAWPDLPGKNKRLKSVRSGHKSTLPPFGNLEIAVSADRKITVKMDGETLFTEPLPSDAAVENLVLRGNTNSYFDDISVEK